VGLFLLTQQFFLSSQSNRSLIFQAILFPRVKIKYLFLPFPVVTAKWTSGNPPLITLCGIMRKRFKVITATLLLEC